MLDNSRTIPKLLAGELIKRVVGYKEGNDKIDALLATTWNNVVYAEIYAIAWGAWSTYSINMTVYMSLSWSWDLRDQHSISTRPR